MAMVIRNRPTRLLFCYVILCVVAMCAAVSGQEPDQPTGEAVLVDEFSRVGECEFSSRIDVFFSELSKKPEHQGYIINYKSADELPGDRNNFVRERVITNHISFRNFDAARIALVKGGYREEMSTELWIVPPGVEPPAPSRTVAEPVTPDKTTFLYAKRYLYSDYEEDFLKEYVLQSVKDREEADRLALEAEWKAEAEQSTEAEPQAETEPESEADTPDAGEEPEPVVDERTAEEKEEERSGWADVGIARLIAERKVGTGVIIFYADDQRYDIGKLTSFIEQGRARLAEYAPIKARYLRVEFGGYRHQPDVEFWFVPAKGKTPKATPDERPVEEPETTPN